MKLEAIVLAAGAGARYGGGKLLAPWRGGVLLDGAMAAAFAAPAHCVHVVWGADHAVAEAALAFAARSGDRSRLNLVYAERHATGLSASLAAGMGALSPDSDGVFVFLGDMPRIPHELTLPMAGALVGGVMAVTVEFEGRRGHPVLFGRELFPMLGRLTGDKGAGALLRGLGDALVRIPSPDDGILFDVDRPEDLAQLNCQHLVIEDSTAGNVTKAS
jgi:molybdenum cofactor cytidylyltransferase